ncbi:MAG: protein kinase [candidate division Zixibacteria bacterium]|nr:protein kinase [candidate division Zixibacteria bacterium]
MIGKTISHYKIESKLGSGGMGEVYLATDTELDRPVALKFLADSLIRDTDARSRFLVEARSASKINHPNVVSVYAMEGVQGSHFISMEYVRGKTLQSVIAGGPIDIPVACDLIKQIAAGVAAAHELNIVHRDVKPSNVIITESGIAKIMDFGLAQIPGTSLITTPGAVMGTVAYMAPEQIQGLEVDARADVFSLGVVFYELLTGQRPFNGDHGAALMYSVVYDEPPPVRELRPEVGNGIQALVTKALSKSAELRYADAREFVHALKSAGAPVAASEPREPHVDIEPPSVRSLAVLYLRNLGNAEDEYLSYGVTEDLIVDLARVGTLRVAPMRSVLQFKDSTTQLGEVARQLNARLILDGSIHRSDRLIRISAQLVDVDQNRTLWATGHRHHSRFEH